MTARDHNNLLGIFFIIKGCLLGFTGLLLGIIYAGIGAVIMGTGHRSDEQIAGGVMMLTFGAVFLAAAIVVVVRSLKRTGGPKMTGHPLIALVSRRTDRSVTTIYLESRSDGKGNRRPAVRVVSDDDREWILYPTEREQRRIGAWLQSQFPDARVIEDAPR